MSDREASPIPQEVADIGLDETVERLFGILLDDGEVTMSRSGGYCVRREEGEIVVYGDDAGMEELGRWDDELR